MRKDTLLKNFNAVFRKDPYILSLVNAMGLQLDDIEILCQKIYANMFFDTMDEDFGIPAMAKTMQINFAEDVTIEEKRSVLQAKWISKGKCSEELLQSIANSWKNGEISVKFENNIIKIVFFNLGGIPEGLENLKIAIDKAKPAYLIADYIFYNFHKNLLNKTHLFLKAYTHKEIRELKFNDTFDLLTYSELEAYTYEQLASKQIIKLMKGEI